MLHLKQLAGVVGSQVRQLPGNEGQFRHVELLRYWPSGQVVHDLVALHDESTLQALPCNKYPAKHDEQLPVTWFKATQPVGIGKHVELMRELPIEHVTQLDALFVHVWQLVLQAVHNPEAPNWPAGQVTQKAKLDVEH